VRATAALVAVALAFTAPTKLAAQGFGNHQPEAATSVASDNSARGLRGFGTPDGILNPSALVLHWRETLPTPGGSEASAGDTLARKTPSDVGRRTRPGWLLPAVGAAIGATAFTFSYVEGCRRADCVGIAFGYTLGFGATAGAAVGLGAELLLRRTTRPRERGRETLSPTPES
jgi:hypothetical protein